MLRVRHAHQLIVLICMIQAVLPQDVLPEGPPQPPIEGLPCQSSANLICNTTIIDTICPVGFILQGSECRERPIECPDRYTWNAQNETCVYTELRCTFGYEERDGTCVLRDRLCPSGYRLVGRNCERIDTKCSDGYEWTNDRCIKSKPVCPEPYKWDGSMCHHTQCPYDFVLRGGVCVQAITVCPTYYYANGTTCVREEPVCPFTGQRWNGTVCYYPVNCHPGYKLVGDSCVLVRINCPVGFVQNGTVCVRPAAICPYGYNLSDGKCVKSMKFCSGSCEPTCQTGYQRVIGTCMLLDCRCRDGFIYSGGRCVCLSNQIVNGTCIGINCPEGTVYSGGACVYNNATRCTWPYSWQQGQCVLGAKICAPGFVYRDGNCRRIIPEVTCPGSSIYQNGYCVQMPDLCPSGYERVNGSCTCTPIPINCPYGYASQQNGTCTPICLNGYRYASDGSCVPDYDACRDGYIWQNGGCVQRPLCGPGYTYRNGFCHGNSQIVDCPAGYELRNGACYPKSVGQCPGGFEWRNGACYSTYCPDGFVRQNGGCVQVGGCSTTCPVGSVLRNGVCMGTETTQCQPGYVFRNGVCTQDGATCPAGFVNRNGICVQESCSGGLTSCPSGFVFRDGVCVQEPTCPYGFVLRNGVCQQDACPPGFIRRNGVCVSQDVDYTCPARYVLRNGVCTTESCPPGFVRRNGVCVRDGYSECPAGTYLHNEECLRFSCPPPYRYEDGECRQTLEPVETHVENHNVIDMPINVTNTNVNNIAVYLGACRSSGQIKTVVIRNNGTETVSCESEADQPRRVPEKERDFSSDGEELDEENELTNERCCKIVSPRRCEKNGDEYTCYNRSKYRCGKFCTADVMYLTPSRRECSQCIGGGYRCVTECYRQPVCETKTNCDFLNYDQFCSEYGEGIC